MRFLIIILKLLLYSATGMRIPDNGTDVVEPSLANLTGDPNKDMYVIHAMVYQVGIITNKTDDEINSNSTMGNQEAITFFHANGSNMDLSHIPVPLITNVTAQRVVGVAPVEDSHGNLGASLPWSHLENLASGHQLTTNDNTDTTKETRHPREDGFDQKQQSYWKSLEIEPRGLTLHKRSSENKTPVKIVSGVAEIPQDVGMHSIAIPPLLSFNNNFSEVPVPIPNTSVVHYAKVNTLVRTP